MISYSFPAVSTKKQRSFLIFRNVDYGIFVSSYCFSDISIN
jgi:hypothetical protein